MNFLIWLIFVLPFVVILWCVEVLYEAISLIALYVWVSVVKIYQIYYRFAFNRSRYLQERKILHATLFPVPKELDKYQAGQWEDN